MNRGRGSALLAAVLSFALAAPGAADEPETTLLLIGDAGAPSASGEPVLRALAREVAAAPGKTIVVFLGDNVYPHGVPAATDPAFREAERRLGDEVRAATSGGARAVFVPGNHDWLLGQEGGVAAVLREGDLVKALGKGRAELLPAAGGPGPAVVDVGTTLRLVLVDTQWWFHSHGKGPGSAAAAVDALADAIEGAGVRRVVVASHHFLRSGGPHGTKPGLLDHLFPLRQLATWAWIPLPVIGSSYPAWRSARGSDQEASSAPYEAMSADLRAAFRRARPLVHAAGHDHSLQVIRGDAASGEASWQVVSGAGYAGGETPVGKVAGALFARPGPGFIRIDFMASGRVELRVVAVWGERAAPAFTLRLD